MKSYYGFIPFVLILLFIIPASVLAAEHSPAAEEKQAVEEPAASSDQLLEKLREASELFDAGLLCEAQEIVNGLIENHPDSAGAAHLLAGRIFRAEGDTSKAEKEFREAARISPVIADYAYMQLVELYAEDGTSGKVIETARLIKNPLLLQDAAKNEISALIVSGRDREAVSAIYKYVKKYPDDWESKLTFATYLDSQGDLDGAVNIYKDLYIHASPFADRALEALKILEADRLTDAEKLERADSLYAGGDFRNAESVYAEVLDALDPEQRTRVTFRIGMCQFMTKRYAEAAETFGYGSNPRWLYWRARSYYRADDLKNFRDVRAEFEKKFPSHEKLALVYLMEADEYRRQGNIAAAEKIYLRVAERFEKSREDALWGLAWMNYMAGKFSKALWNLEQLREFKDSREYYKYLYWDARVRGIVATRCAGEKSRGGEADEFCGRDPDSFFKGLPFDGSYYGYLIREKSGVSSDDPVPSISSVQRPDGERYERIDALAAVGLRDEAVKEIVDAIRHAGTKDELFYLGQKALSLGEYKNVVMFAEPRDEPEFLPYSYPDVYEEVVSRASESEGLDAFLISALMREESRYERDVVSPAGAVGLMQLMPSTARRVARSMRSHLDPSLDLTDPETNILIGSHYLAGLVEEFRIVPFALAAYNAGKNALRRWIGRYYKGDIPEFVENIPYTETRRYVKKVLKSYWQYRYVRGQRLLVSRQWLVSSKK
jgi:soluble lytic murein transglycosylase